jgi:hypothetical protein
LKLNGCFLLLRFGINRLGPVLVQLLAQFGAVVSLVAEHALRRLHPADQPFRDRTVMCFTSGQQNGDQAPECTENLSSGVVVVKSAKDGV